MQRIIGNRVRIPDDLVTVYGQLPRIMPLPQGEKARGA